MEKLPIPINSAHRLHILFTKAKKNSGNVSLLSAWGVVFGLGSKAKSHEVSDMLSLVNSELGRVESAMDSTYLNSRLYANCLNSIKNAIQTTNLSMNWADGGKNLSNEVMQSLLWCAAVLPGDQNVLDEEKRNEIREALENLRGHLSESLPEGLKEAIGYHVNLIERALRGESIIGTTALEEGFIKGYADVSAKKSMFEEHWNDPSVIALNQTWGTLKTTSGTGVNLKLHDAVGKDMLPPPSK